MYNYYYAWKNNPQRARWYKKRLRIIDRGKMNSVLIEFEGGERAIVSGNAIRKVKLPEVIQPDEMPIWFDKLGRGE